MSEHDVGNREETERPWDQPGQDRRDSLPHRGDQLLRWAQLGFFCNFLSWCIPPTGIIGVYVCLIVIIWARSDLTEISARKREQAGEAKTRQAFFTALIGLSIVLVSCVVWGVLLLWGVAFAMMAGAAP